MGKNSEQIRVSFAETYLRGTRKRVSTALEVVARIGRLQGNQSEEFRKERSTLAQECTALRDEAQMMRLDTPASFAEQIAHFVDRLTLPLPSYKEDLLRKAFELFGKTVDYALEDTHGSAEQQATRVLRNARERAAFDEKVEAILQGLKTPVVPKPGKPQ